MVCACIGANGWMEKTWATHLLSLLRVSFFSNGKRKSEIAAKRYNRRMNEKYTSERVSVWFSADTMRCDASSKMCTMTSLLNEKFHHIIGCESMCTLKASWSIHCTAQNCANTHKCVCLCVCETLKDTHSARRKSQHHGYTTVRCSRSCLEREQHASLRFALFFIFFCFCFCVIDVLFCWSLRGTSVFIARPNTLLTSFRCFATCSCLFICSCVYVLAFVFVS